MFRDPVRPRLGGELARSLHRVRDDILEQRARRLAERVRLPTVPELYAGRSVFITGGSGFVGRMIVEQLLRTCPDIGTIYLVVRAKRGQAPQDRLKTLLDVPLFDRLRAEQPDALSKLVVLPGDITELGLGLSTEHQQLLEQVSIVFHVAASVRFDEPFRKAVFTNLRATREVVSLARRMPGLRALVHVSTAYTNTNRDPTEERVYPTDLDWRTAIRIAEEMDAESLWALDVLGHKFRGFQPNTYTLTKAMAEKLIDDVSDELPVVIVRPSIVTNTYTDPIPGWLDNLYGLGGFWVGGAKGVIRIVHAPENNVFDTVPGDIVVKSTILLSWARAHNLPLLRPNDGDGRACTGVEVLHATVGNAGCSFDEMEWFLEEATTKIMSPVVVRDPKVRMTRSHLYYVVLHLYHHLLYGVLLDGLARLTGQEPRLIKSYRAMVMGLTAMRAFLKGFVFEMHNQQYLQVLMHPKDEPAYGLTDFYSCRDNIDTITKWSNDSLRGILEYAIKEKCDPDNIKRLPRIKMIQKLYHGFWTVVAAQAAYFLLLRS